jgi:hypothetical protein
VTATIVFTEVILKQTKVIADQIPMFIVQQIPTAAGADYALLLERSVVAVLVTYGFVGGLTVAIGLTIHGPLKPPILTQLNDFKE